MTPADWVVIAAGVAAIVWVNWYFFLAKRQVTTAPERAGGVQEIDAGAKRGAAQDME